MTIKNTIPVLTLAFMIAAASGSALAAADKADQPGGNQTPPAARQMSPEDQAALTALWKTHQEKMTPLHDQMWAKRMEYNALAANPNTQPSDIKPVIDDMLKLRTRLRAEGEAFFNQLEAKGYDPGQLRGWKKGHGRRWKGEWKGDQFGAPCPGWRDWNDHGHGPRHRGPADDLSGLRGRN